MKQLFAVIRSQSAPWQASRSMEYQKEWEAHASFIAHATAADEIVDPLSTDPWSSQDILRVSRMTPWTLRLGSLS